MAQSAIQASHSQAKVSWSFSTFINKNIVCTVLVSHIQCTKKYKLGTIVAVDRVLGKFC